MDKPDQIKWALYKNDHRPNHGPNHTVSWSKYFCES